MTQDVRRDVRPPFLARALLTLACSRRNREFVIGDLEEEFQDLVDSSSGLRGARRWYWQQAWACCRSTAPKLQKDGAKTEHSASFLSLFRRNLSYALRSLAKAPAFTAGAVLTLALGIGPNTAIFSIVNAVLLRPLPYRDSQRYVVLWETDRSNGNQPWRVAPSNYRDWKKQADVFEDATAFGAYSTTLTGRGEPVQLKGGAVTANYFDVLGVQPLLGRTFQPHDEAEGAPVVVLGYDFWQAHLGGSESIIESSLTLDGTPMTVIGVMPAGIYPSWPVNGPRMYFQSEYQDVWILLPSTVMNYRRSHVFGVVARLKQGVTLMAAQQQMDTIAARLEKEYADDKDEGVLVRPLMDEVAGNVRPALLILLAAVGSVLLIACSNVAGLLLARFTSRRHEIAVRTALGAGRSDLLCQFFLEGLLMALLAGAIGILFADKSLHVLIQLVPQDIPRLADAHLDARVLVFTLGIATLASILFALAPAWTVLRPNLTSELNETSRGNEGLPAQRLRQALVVVQVGMAVVLTVSAGLLAQSFWRLKQVDPGFNTKRLLVAELILPDSKYDSWNKIANFYKRLLEESRRIPGVLSASIAYDHPFESNWLSGFSIVGKPENESWSVQLRIVSPGYFSNVGPALIAGREFRNEEDNTRPGVAIVNESFVHRYLPDGKALGRTVHCTAAASNWKGQMPDRFEIVGIAADVLPPGINVRAEPFFYISSWQFPRWEMKLLVRTALDPLAETSAIRRIVTGLDSQLPVAKFTTMDSELSMAVAQPRLNMVLMGLFSGLALALALVGIYGLIAIWVLARRREIGMRMALGASRSDVLLLVMVRGGVLMASGVAVGLLAALVTSRFLRAQLFGISALDPGTFIAVPVLILLIGLLGCVIPARKAAGLDPMAALRNQ